MVSSRAERPTDFAPRSAQIEGDPNLPCPFCPAAQAEAPYVIQRVDAHGEWQQRVIPNLYPAFDGDQPFSVHTHGPVHIEADASGLHEVFITSRLHDSRPEGDTPEDAVASLQMVVERLRQHAALPNVRYTQAIVNHGREAGASMSHPHGQLLGLPFVPGEILDEERAFTRFTGGCVLCATVEAELVDGKRVVLENDDVVVVCPYWSGSPFEMLIIPREHQLHITDGTDAQLAGAAVAIRDAIGALRRQRGDMAFNAVLHTAPHHYTGSYHWHVHLFPTMFTTAGFERGTGVLINIISPEAAADELRQAFAAR